MLSMATKCSSAACFGFVIFGSGEYSGFFFHNQTAWCAFGTEFVFGLALVYSCISFLGLPGIEKKVMKPMVMVFLHFFFAWRKRMCQPDWENLKFEFSCLWLLNYVGTWNCFDLLATMSRKIPSFAQSRYIECGSNAGSENNSLKGRK